MYTHCNIHYVSPAFSLRPTAEVQETSEAGDIGGFGSDGAEPFGFDEPPAAARVCIV